MAATNVNYVSHDNFMSFATKLKTDFAKKTDIKVDTVQVNGTTLTPTNKVVNITVPTKVSDIQNDSNFQTNVIESVKVNGTALAITDKAVNITMPTDVQNGAEPNQFAFSSITVGPDTVAASAKTDAFELEAGSNVQLTVSGKKITMTATDTTYSAVTAGGSDGLMSGADKTKLDGVAAGAQVNTIEGLTVGGQALELTGKVGALGSAAASTASGTVANDATLPTGAAVMNYVGGLGYQTSSDVQTAITTALGGIQGISFSVVSELPATGEVGTFYLVPNGGSNPNSYAEYVWIDGDPTGSFEKLGDLELDLSNYLTNSNFTEMTSAQIDALFA